MIFAPTLMKIYELADGYAHNSVFAYKTRTTAESSELQFFFVSFNLKWKLKTAFLCYSTAGSIFIPR